MKEVTIIGAGLIGGSLGMALKRSGHYRVTGIGRNKARLGKAVRLRAADAVSTDYAVAASADIIVICTPVDTIAGTLRAVLPYVKPGAVITDVGSVKGTVVRQAAEVVRPFARGKNSPAFVGGHPMAGTEKAGIEHASATLFAGAVVALTPGKETPVAALQAVRQMWRAAGARTLVLSPAEHDRIVALTSHLPHMLAFSLCAAAAELSRNHKNAPLLAAGSFRDATRVAGSDPRDWASICYHNRKELQATLGSFVKLLRRLQKASGNRRRLEDFFVKGRTAKARLARQ